MDLTRTRAEQPRDTLGRDDPGWWSAAAGCKMSVSGTAYIFTKIARRQARGRKEGSIVALLICAKLGEKVR